MSAYVFYKALRTIVRQRKMIVTAFCEPSIHSPCSFLEYVNNKLLWARKYARIVVRGYCLFREANSCPRAKLKGNCELRGTDNVQGQLFVHISEAKSSLLSLLSFKYFLSQRKQQRETKQNKTRSKTRRLLGAFWHCFLNKFPKYRLQEIEEKRSISKFIRQTGVNSDIYVPGDTLFTTWSQLHLSFLR